MCIRDRLSAVSHFRQDIRFLDVCVGVGLDAEQLQIHLPSPLLFAQCPELVLDDKTDAAAAGCHNGAQMLKWCVCNTAQMLKRNICHANYT